jgi:2-polyprenyl-6-methoxyphenol hydroxylase-like FAD-dependent oxidoreductase
MSDPMTERTHVLIAGAGPNGLMLACELALAGVVPVVVEALPGPSDEPKANGLVGQVVRQLDMRGLYRRFTGDAAAPPPSPGWIFAGMPLDFTALQDNPMRALMMTQPRLVCLLLERARELGVEVRWGHSVEDFTPTEDGVGVDLAGPGGRTRVHAGWLVGADGGRSTVRKQAGIDFPGHTSDTVARLAHVGVADRYRTPDGGLLVPGFGAIPAGHNRFDTGMVIYFPAEHDRPMLGTLEYGQRAGAGAGPLTFDELRASLRRVLGVDVPFAPPPGPGPHAMRRIDGQNTRQAQTYRAGRVLLAGDAAHVHSAMGGPGLNLGLQDVLNLGWKLAAVVNGWAPEDLLDTYEAERHPVGRRVMMHSLAQIALAAPGPEVGALRQLFGEVTALPDVTGHLAGLLAGADVRYDMGPGAHPLAGRMVPEGVLDDGRHLTDLLHAGRPVLLQLSGEVAADVPQRVDRVVATMADAPAPTLLIRPDGYVAWAGAGSGDVDGLSDALARWCGAQVSVARMHTVT